MRTFFLLLTLFLFACSDEPEMLETPCATNTLELEVVSTTDSPCGEQMGRIELAGFGGVGELLYSLDGINYQNLPIFEDIPSGSYQVAVLDEEGCATTTVATLRSGISFQETVRPLIQSACAVSTCHVTGQQAPDLSRDANIFSAAFRIKKMILTDNMPPEDSDVAPLNESETQQVVCWINEGAPDN